MIPDVRLVVKRRLLAYLTAPFYAVFFLLNFGPFHGLTSSIVSGVCSLVATALIFAWRLWPQSEIGSLEVSSDAVYFSGRRLFARSAVKKAYGFDAKGESAVRVVTKDAVDLVFTRREEANGFLASLSQSVADTTATFHAFVGGRRTRTLLMVGAMLYFVIGIVALAFAGVEGLIPHGDRLFNTLCAIPLMVPFLLTRHLLIRQLVVGTDGILVKQPFGGTEFLPFRRIVAAEEEKNDLRLQIAGESSPRRFALGGPRRLQGADADVPVRALLRRIEEARARGEQGDTGAATSALLARGRRSVETWMRELAQLTDTAATFRSSAIPRDQLWGVVEDATASTELRAGAALALRRELGDDERPRFRVASNVSAEPALRRVFLAVGSDDELELNAAVEQLEVKVSSPRPSRTS